jgi:hypothetical protein
MIATTIATNALVIMDSEDAVFIGGGLDAGSVITGTVVDATFTTEVFDAGMRLVKMTVIASDMFSDATS